MATDWAATTDAWVADGVIEADQRDGVLARLEALPEPSGALALGPLITVLVAPASFLLIGAVVATLAAVVGPPKAVYDGLLGGYAALLITAGGVGRFVPSIRPVARGLLAAAVPLATGATLSVAEEVHLTGLALVGVLPALLGWAAGLAEGSRALTASASAVTVVAMGFALFDLHGLALGPLVSLLCLGALVATTALRALWPSRDTVLQVGAPALVLLGTVLLVTCEAWFTPALHAVGVRDAWSLEKALAVLGYGTLVLGVGLVGRTGWILVPGVAAMAVATLWVAFTVGSFLGGALALAAVSVGLFGGAVLLWLWPWLREAGPTAPQPG